MRKGVVNKELKALYAVFVRFPIMQVIFIVIEYKISHFFAVIQFNKDNHCHPFSRQWASFLLGNFFW